MNNATLAVNGGEKLIKEAIPLAGFGADLIDEKEENAAVEALRTRTLCRISQPASRSYAKKLEETLCEYLDMPYTLVVNSGASALHSAMVALDIGPGDEVLISGVGWVSIASATINVGAIPVPVGHSEDLCIDLEELEASITEHSKAIVVVHWRGLPADMDGLMEIAKRRNLKVVEDCAQAFGGTYRGRALGTIGDIGCYSFNMHKVITSGEGGALVTRDPECYRRAVSFSGMYSFYRGKYNPDGGNTSMPDIPMLNLRMPEICAAIALAQMKKLEDILERLRSRRDELIEGLKQIPNLKLGKRYDVKGEVGYTIPVVFDTAEDAGRFIGAMYAEGANNITSIAHSFGGGESRGTVEMIRESGMDPAESGLMGIGSTWHCISKHVGPTTGLNPWTLAGIPEAKEPLQLISDSIAKMSRVITFKTNVLMEPRHTALLVEAARKVFAGLEL